MTVSEIYFLPSAFSEWTICARSVSMRGLFPPHTAAKYPLRYQAAGIRQSSSITRISSGSRKWPGRTSVWTAAQESVCASAYTGVTRRRFKEPGKLSNHVPLDVRLIGFNRNIFPAVNTSKRAEAAVSNLTFCSLRQGPSANGTDTAQWNVLVKRLKQATPVEALEKWADEKVRRAAAAARMEIWKGAAAQHRRRSLSDISGVLFFKVAARTRISATHAARRGFRPVDLTISAASVIMREELLSCENFRCALWESCGRGGSEVIVEGVQKSCQEIWIMICTRFLKTPSSLTVGWKRQCVLKWRCSVRRFVAKVLRSLIFHKEAFWRDIGVKKNKQGKNGNPIVDCCWLIAFKYQSRCCSGDISWPKQSTNQEWTDENLLWPLSTDIYLLQYLYYTQCVTHYIAVTSSFINMDTHAKPRYPLCTWHWMMSPRLWWRSQGSNNHPDGIFH